jgi:anti-anti-sigma factor
MKIKTALKGDQFEAVFSDRISFADHDAFRDVIQRVTDSAATSCVFDLARLEAIDSAGLGMFMIARDEARKAGWTITLRSPRGLVKTIMELSKFEQIFEIES